MTDEAPTSRPKPSDRETARARALRENLLRRKAQARGRAADSPSDPEPEPDQAPRKPA